jgi:hypothetical protein
MLEKDLTLGETQWCLVCDEVKQLEQGEAIVRYGSFIEFTCYECKAQKNCGACGLFYVGSHSCAVAFDELIEGISEAIFKVFPNFDNNIKKETWDLMVLSVEEICSQLGKEINK